MKNYLNPLTIGKTTIDNPVFLAPMAGVSDYPYRKMVRKFGAGMVYSEMIASIAMIYDNHRTKKMAETFGDEYPSAVQLAGNDPKIVAQAAKINHDLGAKIIDLNMGCPAKKVIKGMAGSALMKNLKLAQQIISATVKAVDIPVTLKMRLGWDNNSKNFLELSKIAQNEGIQAICIHARTRNQFYSGSALWSDVKNLKEHIKIPIIINGDITDANSAKNALEQSQADGIMIARATYGKPWLIQQISHELQQKEKIHEPSYKQLYNLILEHYENILSYYNNDKGVLIARKHLAWYTKGIQNSAQLRAELNMCDDSKLVKDKLKQFFDIAIAQEPQ